MNKIKNNFQLLFYFKYTILKEVIYRQFHGWSSSERLILQNLNNFLIFGMKKTSKIFEIKFSKIK